MKWGELIFVDDFLFHVISQWKHPQLMLFQVHLWNNGSRTIPSWTIAPQTIALQLIAPRTILPPDNCHCVKSVQIRSFFWSVFPHIRTEYGEIRSISPYSVGMRENTNQKNIRIWTLFTQCVPYANRPPDNLPWTIAPRTIHPPYSIADPTEASWFS